MKFSKSQKFQIAIAGTLMGLVTIVDVSLLKLYTDVIGINATIYGKVLSVIGVINVLNNIWVGVVTDKKAKYVRIMKSVLPIVAILALSLLFIQPTWNEAIIFIVMLSIMIVYEIAKMLYTMNYTVYFLNVTDNVSDRTEISVYRKYLGFIPSGLSSVIPVLLFTGNISNKIVLGTFITCIITGFIVTFISLRSLKSEYLVINNSQKHITFTDIWLSLKVIAKSKTFVLYFLALFTLNAVSSVYFIGYLYYMDNVINVSGILATIPDVAGAVVHIIILAFITKVVNKLGSRDTIRLGILVTSLSYLSLAFVKNYFVVTILYATVMVGWAAYWALQQPLAGTIIDLEELKTGKRKAGMLTAITGIIIMPAYYIMMLVISTLLEYFNYDGSVAVQTAETVRGLRIIICFVPSILLGIALIPLSLLPLNKKREDEISEAIKKKRESEA